MRKNKEKTESKGIVRQTIEDCPILYKMIHRPCTETTMCWGWEFGKGWNRNCQELSYELETLNREFYPRYRVRIQMDQLKEKFGCFTAYYSIVTDHGRALTSILDSVQRISDFCLKRDFGIKYVVDVEPYDYDETREISKEEYDRCLKMKDHISNVTYVEENGKYKRITHLRNYGKKHAKPTKNCVWWYLGNTLRKLYVRFDRMFTKKDNADTRRIVCYLDTKAWEIISKTEEKCANTCEDCGCRIGTDWNPVCQTVGWVTYLCENCAKKHTGNYIMNGKTYNNGIEIQSETR